MNRTSETTSAGYGNPVGFESALGRICRAVWRLVWITVGLGILAFVCVAAFAVITNH